MHVLIAQFNYNASQADLEAEAVQLAPNFAAIPGCFEKTWLIDAAQNTAGGVYKFDTEASALAYLASPLWKGVESMPHFSNLTTRVFATMEEPTRLTRGVPAVAMAR